MNVTKARNQILKALAANEKIIRVPFKELNYQIKETPASIKVEGTIPLKKHFQYSLTRIEFREKYNKGSDLPRTYQYKWKLDRTGGPQTVHISEWGKEPHPNSSIATDPYHHHHVPFDRPQRKACYHIRTLQDVMHFVGEHIIHQIRYNPRSMT